jgi:hypothetical protein
MTELLKLLTENSRGAAIVVKVPGAEYSESDGGTALGSASADGAVASISWPFIINVAYANASSGAFQSETVQPTGGFGNFASLAQTTWKEKVDHKFCTDGGGEIKCADLTPLPTPKSSPLSAFADFLPHPSLVESAEVSVFWSASDIVMGYEIPQNGGGSSDIQISMDDDIVFSGGVFGGKDWARFTGDLKKYKSSFVVGNGVSASDLELSGVVTRKLDYAAFYENPSVSYELSMSLSARASGAIPEPAAWALMIFGFGFIGGAVRRRRDVAVLAIESGVRG